MAKNTLTVNIKIDGLRETLAAFRKLPKDASKELRERTWAVAELLASRAATAGRADSRQSALVAGTVRPRKDRVPSIVVGGLKRVGRNRVPAYKVLFGAEFGATRLKQFRPHRGRRGYWFFSTVEREQPEMSTAWNRVASDIVRHFSDDDIGGG